MPSEPGRNIVLIGFMGSGKTKIGKRVAELTGRTFVDTDDLIVARNGRTIPEIFEAEGEAGFRARERTAVASAARRKNTVIATGGGAVVDKRNVEALKRNGTLVYLKATPGELVRQLSTSAQKRPMLDSSKGLQARVDELISTRAPIYEAAADLAVDIDGRPRPDIAAEIASRLQNRQVKKVVVRVQPAYPVVAGSGLLSDGSAYMRLPKGAERVGIVSHPRIRKLWGASLEASLRDVEPIWCTFPQGEESKTPETAARISQTLAREGFHRGDVLIALGGGVVGDVTGYVASTFNRGIAYVQVPTTLLGMVDSAIGGKTGVNLPQGKNLVGTFHHPLAVLADTEVLSTLPKRQLRGGLAEVAKYGFISDRSILDLLVARKREIFSYGPVLEEIVLRSAKIKADVVAADEREADLRAILNYGHTLGHAIESLAVDSSGGSTLHHGEAIAVGMVYASAVSKLVGGPDLVALHRETFDALGLPTYIEGFRWKEVRNKMAVDKKYSGGFRFVLLEDIAKPVVRSVDEDILRRAFSEVTG